MEVAGQELDARSGGAGHALDRSEESRPHPDLRVLEQGVRRGEQARHEEHVVEVGACAERIEDALRLPADEPAVTTSRGG